MSKLICLMGESGAGKTTSLRNLPPNETIYIDADGKGLAWKGWRNQYSKENKNYIKTNNAVDIMTYMQRISENKAYAHVKYIVIDTLNSIMVADEMQRVKDKGYDKWVDLAQSVYYIVTDANNLRDNLTIILTAHTQTDTDDAGQNLFTHIKTNGKKLNKICLESFMPTVLLARCKDGDYVFEVQANNSSAKSPMGAFETKEIPNDIMLVIKALEEF